MAYNAFPPHFMSCTILSDYCLSWFQEGKNDGRGPFLYTLDRRESRGVGALGAQAPPRWLQRFFLNFCPQTRYGERFYGSQSRGMAFHLNRLRVPIYTSVAWKALKPLMFRQMPVAACWTVRACTIQWECYSFNI